MSFDIFENKSHATCAAGLTKKTFFIFCIFWKGELCDASSQLDTKTIFMTFIVKKEVLCDAIDQLDTKTIFIIFVFKKKCRATRTVD